MWIRRAATGIVALAALLLSVSAQTYTISNRILVLTTTAGGEDAPLLTFKSYELQYDVVVVPSSGVSGNLNLYNSNGAPLYSLIVVTSRNLAYSVNGVWTSSLTTAQWTYLETYERTYGVRRVVLNDSPAAEDGVAYANTVAWGSGAAQTVSLVASYAALANVKSSATVVTTGLYHYPAVAAAVPSTVSSVTPVAYFEAYGTDFPSRTLAAVVVTYSDGREVMRWYTSFAYWSTCSLLLDHVWLAWGTRGLLSGWRRTIFLPQVDDLFLTTEITPTNSAPTYNFRVSVADFQGIVSWQKDFNSRLPAGSSFKLEHCFNGNGILEAAKDAAFIDIDTESHVAVEYIKPKGAAGDHRWPSSFSTAWTDSTLRNKDALYSYLVGGELATGNFWYTSHTFTHENFDNAGSVDVDNELKVNLKMAGAGFLNLVGSPYWSSVTMVTPQISGLHNEYALQTLLNNGITSIVGDNSRPSVTPSNPYDFWVSTQASSNFDGYLVVPRWPCHIYYHCTQPSEIEYIYNVMYNQTLGMSTWSQILSREQDRVLQLLLGIRHDPTMFHQANLRNADMPTVTVGGYTGKLGVLQQWIETVFSAYNNLVNWPVISPKGDDVAQIYREKTARNNCGVSTAYDLSVASNNVATISAVRVTSTGSCKVPVTVPGGVSLGAGMTSEKIGNDFTTVWIDSVPGTTQTFSLNPPITFSMTYKSSGPHSQCGQDSQCGSGKCWKCSAGGWNCGPDSYTACGENVGNVGVVHDQCGSNTQCAAGSKCYPCPSFGYNCGADSIAACGVTGISPLPDPTTTTTTTVTASPTPHSLCGSDNQCGSGACYKCGYGGWNCASDSVAACGVAGVGTVGDKQSSTTTATPAPTHSLCGSDNQCGSGACYKCGYGGWNCGGDSTAACGVAGVDTVGDKTSSTTTTTSTASPTPHSMCGSDNQCPGGFCYKCGNGGWNCGGDRAAACGAAGVGTVGDKTSSTTTTTSTASPTPHSMCGSDKQCGYGSCYKCGYGGWNCGEDSTAACGVAGVDTVGDKNTQHSDCGLSSQCPGGACYPCPSGGYNCGTSSTNACGVGGLSPV